MSTPPLSSVPRPVIGEFYLVPCIKVDGLARADWMDASGWVPVLGAKHRDADHLEVDFEHFHVDWRFVGETGYKRLARRRFSHLGTVISNDGTDAFDHGLWNPPALRRIKCKRAMPTFPDRCALEAESGSGYYRTPIVRRWERLERAQAITCNKLKPGNICPHRGASRSTSSRNRMAPLSARGTACAGTSPRAN